MVRWRNDSVVAGVARGIAHWFDVNPVWVRLLFVAMTFWLGAGLIAYGVLALALPKVDQQPPETAGSRSPRDFWLVAGGLVALAFLTSFRGVGDLGVVLPVVAIALGVALWQRPGDDSGGVRSGSQVPPRVPPRPDPGATAPGTAVPDMSVPVAAVSQVGTGPPTPPEATLPSPRWWQPPPARPRPSWLGPVALAVAAITAAFQYAMDLLDVVDVTLTQGLAIALGIIGVALLIGALWGRAKWLAAPAVVLAAALVVSQSADFLGIDLGRALSNPVAVTVTNPDAVPMGVGSTTLDLSRDDAWRDGPVDVEFGAGDLTVVVPWDADVDLHVAVGAGVLEIEEALPLSSSTRGGLEWTRIAGVVRADQVHPSPWLEDADVLDLNVTLGAGGVAIRRGWPPEEMSAGTAPAEPSDPTEMAPTPSPVPSEGES